MATLLIADSVVRVYSLISPPPTPLPPKKLPRKRTTSSKDSGLGLHSPKISVLKSPIASTITSPTSVSSSSSPSTSPLSRFPFPSTASTTSTSSLSPSPSPSPRLGHGVRSISTGPSTPGTGDRTRRSSNASTISRRTSASTNSRAFVPASSEHAPPMLSSSTEFPELGETPTATPTRTTSSSPRSSLNLHNSTTEDTPNSTPTPSAPPSPAKLKKKRSFALPSFGRKREESGTGQSSMERLKATLGGGGSGGKK